MTTCYIIQDQSDEIDPYSHDTLPLNTVSVRLSHQRSLLSVINFTSENAGTYECRGTSKQGTMLFDLVFLSIGKFIT